ncbi:MAG: helix-turn-helix transcriptional regulator [Selenomonas ruminantium]|uniref:Helix-turn-helix transcriptional regulator n=1 Tax=Selenomonas ruminantium TaxID=971 RepID=A0A927ZV13_SELRU|nr:helix-turn-helix transcriptional regulator [Selenomonas ruminantium]
MELNIKAIRFAMAEKRLNISSLARAAGLSPTTLNQWLNHGKNPRIDKLGALAGALGVSYTEIVKDEEC